MSKELFLKNLENRYCHYYDIKETPSFVPFPLDLYAHFYQSNAKYFATKKISVWRMDHEEHCLVKCYDTLEENDLARMIRTAKMAVDYLVKPSPDHMKTYITVVVPTWSPLTQELRNYIEKFRYSKAYKLYLHGWCDLRLVVIDLSSRQVVCNKAGKEVSRFYEHLLKDSDDNITKEATL